jgi:hypothetical protein
MRGDRVFSRVACVLQTFFRVGEKFFCCFVDRFRLVENDDRFLA